MKAIDLVKPIEELAPLCSQEQWDNCGFSIGDYNKDVKKALIALDCTEAVMDEAIEKKADIIITHHPLIFRGVKKISPDNEIGRIIYKGIRNNIIVYSAHTNLDKAQGGVSCMMADKLNLLNTEVLTEDGFGIVGDLDCEMSAASFIPFVKERFNLEFVRTSRVIEDTIKKVAVCGGSGHSFIADAVKKGAQVYITGDISYHDFYRENNFMLMDIGHYSSEYDIVHVLANIFSKKFPTFAVSISERNNNPIYYY